MKKLFLLLAAIMVTTVCAMAQNRSVSGVVLDAETDEPLFGATVQPIGGGTGTATDINGIFRLNVPASVKNLKVSYVGMVEQTVPVSDNVVVKLQTSDNVLDAVVVTGYGSGKKLGSLVGSVSVVGDQVLEDSPSTTFVDALQGQVAGLSIFSNSGEPSSTPANIRIRGVNSLNASTTPLFILDGAPVTSAVFTTINPNDIESVTVLKDAASTAIYGSRAANGVIVITTKKGRYGDKATVTVRANVGWSNRASTNLDMMDSKQYALFRERVGAPLGEEALYVINDLGISTDWINELVKNNALTYSVEGRVSGGTEKTRYYLSVGHYDQDGLIEMSGFQRQTISTNLDTKVNNWFQVGLSGNFGFETYQSNSAAAANSDNGGIYTNNPFFSALNLLPYDSPRYYTVDEATGKPVYGAEAQWYKYSQRINPNWFNSKLRSSKRTNLSAMMNLYEQITPLRGLTIRAQQAMTAFDYRSTSYNTSFEPETTPMGDILNVTQSPSRGEAFQRWYQFTYTNTAEYKFDINSAHYLTFLLGQESIIARNNAFNVSTSGQPSDIQNLLTQGTSVTMGNVGQSLSRSVINSYFFNFNYEYDSRYFFDFNIRRDGSSKFAPGHRWATFFAVGAMWDAKNEKFLQDVKWLDALKFRVNYGTTGNSGISDYSYQGTVGTGGIYNGQSSMGIASQSNNDLSWETVRAFDLGTDFSIFDKFHGSVDWYYKHTVDMLMSIPYSCTTGFTSGVANIGAMTNRGVDLDVAYDIYKSKDWFVGVNVNFGYNQVLITKLFNGLQRFEMPEYGLVYEVGVNPYNLYLVKSAGLDMADGRPLYYTKDGNITKTYSDMNQVDMGKSYIAPWTGGFGLQARYKNLSLRADFNWAAEKYLINSTFWYVQCADVAVNRNYNQTTHMLDVWYPGKTEVTDVPGITDINGNPVECEMTDRFLENSSFLRLKNLTVTYNLPKSWMQAAKMENVAFHFTGRNLLTFTGYHGVDPEYENNVVQMTYPNTRQFEFGVEVTF